MVEYGCAEDWRCSLPLPRKIVGEETRCAALNGLEYGKNCIAIKRHVGVSRIYWASTGALRSTVLPNLQFFLARTQSMPKVA